MCKGTYALGDKTYYCSCPTCYPLHDMALMWPYTGEAWTDNRQDKPRRIALIRSVWHLSKDHELLTTIHTAWFNQRSVAHAAAMNLRHNYPRQTGLDSAQETLNLLD